MLVAVVAHWFVGNDKCNCCGELNGGVIFMGCHLKHSLFLLLFSFPFLALLQCPEHSIPFNGCRKNGVKIIVHTMKILKGVTLGQIFIAC